MCYVVSINGMKPFHNRIQLSVRIVHRELEFQLVPVTEVCGMLGIERDTMKKQ
jgi:hypothetical protein